MGKLKFTLSVLAGIAISIGVIFAMDFVNETFTGKGLFS